MMHLKLKAFLGACATAFAIQAYAADAPLVGKASAAPVSTPISWTGAYGGFTLGYGWTGSDSTIGANDVNSATLLNRGLFQTTTSTRASGAEIGLRGGYDYQMPHFANGRVVVGIGGEWFWAGLNGTTYAGGNLVNVPIATKVNSDFDVYARLGYLVTSQDLIYGKIGGSWANVTTTATWGGLLCSPGTGVSCQSANTAGYRSGLLIGGGWEHRFNQNISLALEYNYRDLGTQSTNFGITAGKTNASFTSSQAIFLQDIKLVGTYRF